MADKTLDQLTALTTLSETDLFAVYDQANAVLRKMAASVLVDLLIDAGAASYLAKASNLSDLTSASSARANLGLGTSAVQNVGAFLQVANNLSDIASASSARTNLGLGSLATLSQVPNGSIGNTQLAAGAAVANLGFTPPSLTGVSNISGAYVFSKFQTGPYGSGAEPVVFTGQGGGPVWAYDTGVNGFVTIYQEPGPISVLSVARPGVEPKIYLNANTGGIVATDFTVTSDARRKTNIEDLELTAPLRPVSYEWREPAEGGDGRRLGFIAQEVREVAPEAVSEYGSGELSVNAVAICAILAAQVNALRAKVEALEAR